MLVSRYATTSVGLLLNISCIDGITSIRLSVNDDGKASVCTDATTWRCTQIESY